jgi:alginate O-acetyltransferase complex protein AlgJ
VSNEPDIPVGHDEPLKPTHSLPRYSEPTPETHRKVSREEEAELALKNTLYSSGTRIVLILAFLLTILSVPAIQFASEMRSSGGSPRLGTFNLFKAYPSWEKIKAARSAHELWRLLPRGSELKAAEKEMETQSVVSEWFLPRVQWLLSEKLGAGNEQVYLGRDGWLFYRPDVDYITGPSFLDSAIALHREHAGVQPDPLKAITDFRDQLRARGIDLIVVPVPMKPGVDGERLSPRAPRESVFQNDSFSEFKKSLEEKSVRVFDPLPRLAARKAASPDRSLYLRSDTHWRPETTEFVAQELAQFVRPGAVPIAGDPLAQEITGTGDIARMLKLPERQQVFPPEPVTIHPVSAKGGPWRASKAAEVLLLGDSFSNIYSLGALGWGESAGFAEHLSRVLAQPLDCILRNSDAAFATREILSRELARGHDRLAGKKLVIWQFATRELAFGDWKLLKMQLGQPKPANFFVPKSGETVTATATVQAVSNVPRPGTVPYRDHILALHLVDVLPADGGAKDSFESLVYLESMRDNVLTPAARLAPGDRITLSLRAWSDVSDKFEKINRSEIDDAAVQLEEPCWAELIQ